MPDIKRRDFLKRTIQLGIAGGMISFGVFLGLRKPIDNTDPDSCVKRDPCNQCNHFRGCTQPKALAFMKKNDHKMKPQSAQRKRTENIHLNQ